MREMKLRQALPLILCNYFSLFHVLSCVACAVWVPGWYGKVGAALACLYLLPVICTRLALLLHPLRPGKIRMLSLDYYVWWFTFCTQVLYVRFPMLEESLRCVPSLYSFWLRLWGSKIGKLVYWAPGTLVLDRSFLRVGDHAYFALGTRVCPHVHVDGELILAPVVIGERAVTGAYSLLVAGTEVRDGEALRAVQLSPPFTVWENGKRRRD